MVLRPDVHRGGRKFMTFVYIIQSLKNGRYYVGHTDNVLNRLEEHNRGKTSSIKNSTPFEIKFSQKFKTKEEAIHVENKLKKWKNRNIIERIITDGVIESV
jgi:putative endonuclease